MLFPSIFIFSSRRKEKENHREGKSAEKGESLPSNSHSTLSLLAPAPSLLFCPFFSSTFSLASFSSQVNKKKEKHKKRKNHREEKKCKEGRKLTFLLLLLHLG
jgi:hypothetical protein